MNDITGSPVALIASACRWRSTRELATSLSDVGFRVGFIGPRDHPIDNQPGSCQRFVLGSLAPARTIGTAIDSLKPDIIIPADEMIVQILHRLHRRNADLRPLIERSLGAPEHYGSVLSRVALAEIAQEEGLAAPTTLRVTSTHALPPLLKAIGLPAYLKADASWGGVGVIRAESVEACVQAYRRLQLMRFRDIGRSAWRMAVARDGARTPLRTARLELSLQSAVAGQPANCAVMAWRGEMLACIEAAALNTIGPTGAATAVRILANQPMREACGRLVKRLGLSGLIGFDFMLDSETGRANVIELNARATQTCHLRIGAGADPPAAFWAAVTGRSVRSHAAATAGDIVELFPRDASEAIEPRLLPDTQPITSI